MHIISAFLLLIIAKSSADKQGDFGIFTACSTPEKHLKLQCRYPSCNDNTPFSCSFTNEFGAVIGSEKCNFTIKGHAVAHANSTTKYVCTLTRRLREEVKELTVTYTGKGRIKPCSSAGDLLVDSATAVWPMVLLSLLKAVL